MIVASTGSFPDSALRILHSAFTSLLTLTATRTLLWYRRSRRRLLTIPARSDLMTEQRWLRIIPVALIMYTISYIDRTNIALALDPKLSPMMQFLGMDDKIKGNAVGVFFFGYLLLQIPSGYLANRWSPRKLISIFLVCWGACAIGCGLVNTTAQLKMMRFLLGIAESGVYPATLVLLCNWFPRAERARANAYWNLCQPLAVAGAAPITGK